MLTIAIAVYDDYEGFYWTTKNLSLYHPTARDCELLVINQSPDSGQGQATAKYTTRKLKRRFARVRHVAYRDPVGIGPARNRIFDLAETEWVLVLDSHVALWPDALLKLQCRIADDPTCSDLFTGPLMSDDGYWLIGTHQTLRWRGEALGTWAIDDRGMDLAGEPFEIPTQGLGCFACRRDAFPRFHPSQRGFGCCEPAFCEQFRDRGDRVLCLPFMRWEHRFWRVGGKPPYSLRRVDKIANACLEFQRLGMDPAGLFEHFDGKLNDREMEVLLGRIGSPQETTGEIVSG